MIEPAVPPTQRILFVCLGNICRSPTAEGLMRACANAAERGDRFVIDSAGVGGWHVGNPPDPRAVAAAARRGVDLSGLRARQVCRTDFDRFDLILAMDGDNLSALRRLSPEGRRARMKLATAYAGPGAPEDVADPYYGGTDGFERTLDLLERVSDGLLAAAPE